MGCSTELSIGSRAGWDRGSRIVRCPACVDSLVAVDAVDVLIGAEPVIAASMPGAPATANELPSVQTGPSLFGTGGIHAGYLRSAPIAGSAASSKQRAT